MRILFVSSSPLNVLHSGFEFSGMLSHAGVRWCGEGLARHHYTQARAGRRARLTRLAHAIACFGFQRGCFLPRWRTGRSCYDDI